MIAVWQWTAKIARGRAMGSARVRRIKAQMNDARVWRQMQLSGCDPGCGTHGAVYTWGSPFGTGVVRQMAAQGFFLHLVPPPGRYMEE